MNLKETEALAKHLRNTVLDLVSEANSSHVGSAFSIAEILSVLYNGVMNITPDTVKDDDRDIFIMSKGHAVSILYAVLAEKGFFPKEWLKTFYKNDTVLAGHATSKGVPGIELSTGSLGHGLPVAVGIVYGARLKKQDKHVWVLLSDGECNEGTIWEAALFAAHHCLNNLVVIIDYNKIQSLGFVEDVMRIEPFGDKWRSFGWDVMEVDGHDTEQLYGSFNKAKDSATKPVVIIAHTVKGKGVSFMENTVLWHYRTPKGDELQQAKLQIEEGKV